VAADLRLERYVQRKLRRGREHFYFRIVKDGKEQRRPLPHPFDAAYRAAYDEAHRHFFGTVPGEFDSPTGVRALIRAHRDSERYKRLPKASRTLRDLALDLLEERWGEFEAGAIRPLHAQALYDSLADRPATANRRLDDISATFGWGRTRGFCDENPCARIERIDAAEPYEPWPADALDVLLTKGKREVVKVALVGAYTGQRRADCLQLLRDDLIDGATWYPKQGKTGNEVPVPLHPVVLSILEDERAARRKAGIVDPRRPLLSNSRGQPWTPSGFGASWRTELIRLGLRPRKKDEIADGAFRPTFHGLRHTSATLIATSVARHPEHFGGIARVKSMLGHLSEKMARHYARRAEVEHMNAETMLLIPEIGNRPAWIGNPAEDEVVSD